MLYSEIKRAVLSRIHQYSIAGKTVAASYNNQADYLNRIPQLINDGLVNIRTSVKPILAVHDLCCAEDYGGGMYRFKLPGDFRYLKSGGVTVIQNGVFTHTNEYHLQGRDYILIPADTDGPYTIEYYRYPDQLPADPTDDFELDEDPDVIQTAIYYAAANLVMYDDQYAYASLYNDYESRLSRMTAGVAVEVHPVDDAYSFFVGGDV